MDLVLLYMDSDRKRLVVSAGSLPRLLSWCIMHVHDAWCALGESIVTRQACVSCIGARLFRPEADRLGCGYGPFDLKSIVVGTSFSTVNKSHQFTDGTLGVPPCCSSMFVL